MRPTSEVHERCWNSLPWLVNGSLPETERQWVATHAMSCPECREEWARHLELHRQMRGGDDATAAPSASWNKLLARIEAHDAQAPSSMPSESRRGAARRGLVAALWIQGVTIALLALALLGTETPAPRYSTLSSVAAPTSRSTVRVVFAPDASIAQINRLLREIEGQLIAGPSEAGVYTVAIDARAASTAISTLRSRPGVLFAEPGIAAHEHAQ